ncbi:hypothetical protein [Deinococcus peraridilitoris]|nr:hypothetical protein [Deinococcus peraridilitoris]
MTVTAEAPIKLLEVARHLPELSRYAPGNLLCIERRGRPWRLAWIREADAGTVTTANGFVYDRMSGVRLVPAEGGTDTACPLTLERLEYLMVLEFLKCAEKIRPAHLPASRVQSFAPVARAFLQLMDEQGSAPDGRLTERT